MPERDQCSFEAVDHSEDDQIFCMYAFCRQKVRYCICTVLCRETQIAAESDKYSRSPSLSGIFGWRPSVMNYWKSDVPKLELQKSSETQIWPSVCRVVFPYKLQLHLVESQNCFYNVYLNTMNNLRITALSDWQDNIWKALNGFDMQATWKIVWSLLLHMESQTGIICTQRESLASRQSILH